MAQYAPQDAITYAKEFIKSMKIDTAGSIRYQIVDYVASKLWMAAPWKWTIGTLPIITVVAGTSDYAVTPPADFLYLNKANLSDGSLTNELKLVASLATSTNQIGIPSQVAYMDASSLVRINPIPPTGFSQTLNMLYKKSPPKLISSNYATAGAQIFPDCYYPVFQEGVLWLSYLYADDSRAGNATVDHEGKTQYSQQLGVFQASIAEMRRIEKLTLDYPGSPNSHG